MLKDMFWTVYGMPFKAIQCFFFLPASIQEKIWQPKAMTYTQVIYIMRMANPENVLKCAHNPPLNIHNILYINIHETFGIIHQL